MALLQQLPFSFVQPEQDPASTTNTLQKMGWMPSAVKALPSPPPNDASQDERAKQPWSTPASPRGRGDAPRASCRVVFEWTLVSARWVRNLLAQQLLVQTQTKSTLLPPDPVIFKIQSLMLITPNFITGQRDQDLGSQISLKLGLA